MILIYFFLKLLKTPMLQVVKYSTSIFTFKPMTLCDEGMYKSIMLVDRLGISS